MRLAWVVGAFLVPIGHGGTDGAMALFYEQQLEAGNLDQFKSGPLVGIDVAGKLVPVVLKVGALVNRGQPASTQYREVHNWLRHLIASGVALLLVFDGYGRYPPKAFRAHAERAKVEQKNRAEAMRLDAAGDMDRASKFWERVVHRPTLRDLVQFTAHPARSPMDDG